MKRFNPLPLLVIVMVVNGVVRMVAGNNSAMDEAEVRPFYGCYFAGDAMVLRFTKGSASFGGQEAQAEAKREKGDFVALDRPVRLVTTKDGPGLKRGGTVSRLPMKTAPIRLSVVNGTDTAMVDLVRRDCS